MKLEIQKYINKIRSNNSMKKEIYLEDLAPFLQKTHVKLNLSFLNELLKNASKSSKPYKNREFAKKIDCPINKKEKSAMTIYGWMIGHRTVPFSKLTKIIDLSDYTWKDVEENLITIKAGIRGGEVSLKFPIKINKSMGSIIGHILGDGCIDKRFSRISYFNSNIDLLKEFIDCMSNIFGRKALIYIEEKRKFEEKGKKCRINSLKEVIKDYNVSLVYPKLCSMVLYTLFDEFAKGKDKRITAKIINSDGEFKKGLIRAFFDDEGSVSSDNYTIRFHQNNKKLLGKIRLLIKGLGIKSQKIKSYLKRNKLRYYFNICGFKEYYRFYHSIGCASLDKRKEFELLINKVKNSKYFKKKYTL